MVRWGKVEPATEDEEDETSAVDDDGPSAEERVASVDLNEFVQDDGEEDEERVDAFLQLARVQAAVMAGASLSRGIRKAIDDGSIELGVDLADEAWEEIQSFALEGMRLSAEALGFVRDRAATIVAALREDLPGAIDVLMETCRDLAELGCDAFAAIGAALSIAARQIGVAVSKVDWIGLYESGKDTAASFAAAAGEAADECGRITGTILQSGWDLLDESEKEEAAGGMENAAGVTQSLEDAAITGSFGDSVDAVASVLSAVAARLSDDVLQFLQRSVGALCRAGIDSGKKLWEALGPIVAGLIEDGRPLINLALEEVGSSLAMVERYAEVCLDYAGLALGASADFSAAAARAARENVKVVGALLHDAVSALINEKALDDVRGEVLEALALMRDAGVPIVGRILHEIAATNRAILDKLSDIDVKKLQTAVALAARAGLAGMQRLWDEIQALVPVLIEEGREALELINLPSREEVRRAVKAGLGVVGDAWEASSTMAHGAAMATKEGALAAGGLLHSAVVSLMESGTIETISEALMREIEELKDWGDPVIGAALEELKGLIGSVVDYLDDVQVEELQRAVSACARAGLKDFVDLWGSVREAVLSAVERGREIVVHASPVIGDMVSAAAAVAEENAQFAGRVLHNGLQKLVDSEIISNVSNALQEALIAMRDFGAPIVGDALAELKALCGGIVDQLSDVQVEDLQRAVIYCARAAMDGFAELWEAIRDAVRFAIEGGRQLVEHAGPMIDQAAEFAGEQFDGMLNSDILEKGFGHLEDFYDAGRRETVEAFRKIAGATAGCCKEHVFPLVKLEIFRDIFQQLGLFFANLFDSVQEGIAFAARAVWGFIGNLIAIDLGHLLPNQSTLIVAGIVVLVTAAVVLVAGYLWFLCASFGAQSDELREGHEAENWREKKQKESKKIGRMGLILTGVLSIYLPLARTSVEILHCNGNYQYMLSSVTDIEAFQCDSGFMKSIAIFFLLVFVIPLPFCLVYFILKDKPQGTPENPDIAYDEDGLEVPFTDKLYNERVENDPNQIASPFRSLYKGYERKWSFYKVAVMLFKLVLVFPVIFLAPTYKKDEYKELKECQENFETQDYQFEDVSFVEDKESCSDYVNEKYGVESSSGSQSGVTLALVAVFSGLSFYSTPFIDPSSDVMDAGGRVTSIVTTAVATIFAATNMDQKGGAASFLGIILMLCNLVNFCVMVGIVAFGFPAFRLWYKNRRKILDFSDTCTGLTQIRAEVAIPNWDIDKEVKHRIWHAFWDSVLLNACGEEVAARFLQIKDKTRDFGLEKIKLHWQGHSDPLIKNLRVKARRELEGVDLYWNDSDTLDGQLNSATKFGKMYIRPYPFHLVFVYDDSDDVTFIWGDDKLKAFIAQQEQPEILEAVTNRRKLRGLANSGGSFDLPFSRQESETVQDGFDTVEIDDGEGGKKTQKVPHMSTVHFEVFYTSGKVQIGANTDKKMSAGFIPTMHYYDGHGEARLPRTGQMKQFTNRYACLGQEHLGIHGGSFRTTSRLEEVFAASEHFWTAAMTDLLEEFQKYRNDIFEEIEALEDTSILGNGFWYYVYNNEKVNRTNLELYLRETEENPTLNSFPDDHKAGLDYLYLRMRYVRSHPACALWYIFWADFYEENKDLEQVTSCRDDFAPSSGSSICYRPLSRQVLRVFLDKRDLSGFFSDSILDVLFGRIDQLKKEAALQV